MEVGSFFCFCFSVCYLLCNLPIILFYNTTVNVDPLSLPNFEKVVPHFEQIVCSHAGSLRLRLFLSYFFVCWFSDIPCHPTGPDGPILGRFGCHVWSIFWSLKFRSPRSWKTKRVGGTAEGITIRRPLLAGDRASQTRPQTLHDSAWLCRLQKLFGRSPEFRRPYRRRFSVHTSAFFFQIFFILLTAQKIIKNQTYQICPKSQNRSPGCPKLDFGAILDDFWHHFFDQFSWPPKSRNLQQV